jgi:ferredoxin/flavodoxin---NADP+ reductase
VDKFVFNPPPAPNGAVSWEQVLNVQHWNDRLFSFRLTRPAGFRFRAGEFVMIGLMNGDKPLLRAYSVASPTWDESLEFYSIKVPDGPLTSRLQAIQPGDYVLMGKKPTGTLVLDALTPGERLYFFCTGTGIAPFASLIREPDTYERFQHVYLVHTCRFKSELAYGEALTAATKADPLVGEMASAQLTYVTTLTRDAHARQGRLTTLIETGELFHDLGVQPLSPARDRAMICGSRAMLLDTKRLCEAAGLREGSLNAPGEFVVERAFVD